MSMGAVGAAFTVHFVRVDGCRAHPRAGGGKLPRAPGGVKLVAPVPGTMTRRRQRHGSGAARPIPYSLFPVPYSLKFHAA